MPYASEEQRRKFHILLEQGKISKATVDEFDKASEGMDLPDRAGPTRTGKIRSAMDQDHASRRKFYGQ